MAGHDVSDGGLLTCLLEMGFGGHCGLKADILHKGTESPLNVLFAEEIGWVLEVGSLHIEKVLSEFKRNDVPCFPIGCSSQPGPTAKIEISVNGEVAVESTVLELLTSWEETSYQLDKRQANPACVASEFNSYRTRIGPKFRMKTNPKNISIHSGPSLCKPLILIHFII